MNKIAFNHSKHEHIDPIFIEELTPKFEAEFASIVESHLPMYYGMKAPVASRMRLERLGEINEIPGHRIFVAVSKTNPAECLGGVSIGSLHGLPYGDGIGEIRDLVVANQYRGRGIGSALFQHALLIAREFGYKQIYLEATPNMKNAARLFRRFGFEPVISRSISAPWQQPIYEAHDIPCYYIRA